MNNQTRQNKNPLILFGLVLAIILIALVSRCDADGPVVMTWYSPETSGGDWLRCGYLYHSVNVPFVAVDDGVYERLAHHRVYGVADGIRFSAVVLGSGYFENKFVEQQSGELWPIVLDLGQQWFVWPGLSVQVQYEVTLDSWWGLVEK